MNMNRRQNMNDQKPQIDGDGIDRRGFLKCMAWVGTGVIWTISSGGILASRALGQAGGLGVLGDEQLRWLAKDVEGLSDSTPIVVFAHVPLWTIYPKWGWATQDSEQALALLKRFANVTVLNGHIHQVLQKVEGNATF